jgi:FkbM family methyltransferase
MQADQPQIAFAPLRVGRGSTTVQVGYNPDVKDDFTQAVLRGVNPTAWLTDLLRKFSRGGVVLDLGANIGCFSLAAAKLGYTVLAVEASSRNVRLLNEGVRANCFESVEVVHAAVTDIPREINFFEHGPYGYVDLHQKNARTNPVRGVTVDELLAERKTPKVGFVKLDVEGSELAALRGMQKLLAGPDAPPVVFESNTATQNLMRTTPGELYGEFAKHGYHLYTIRSGYFRAFLPRTPTAPQPKFSLTASP